MSGWGDEDDEPTRPALQASSSDGIAESVEKIDADVKTLKTSTDSIGTLRDSHKLRANIKRLQESIKKDIKAVQADLASADGGSHRVQQKLKSQVAELNKQFSKLSVDATRKAREHVLPGISAVVCIAVPWPSVECVSLICLLRPAMQMK